MQDFGPLPTSEEELAAQINEAFKPDEPQEPPQGARRPDPEAPDPQTDSGPEGVEYQEPTPEASEATVASIAGFLQTRANPKLVSLGTSELAEEEIKALAHSMGAVVACVPNPVEKVLAKAETMSPLGQALLGLGVVTASLAVPRVLDAVFNRNMRDVTPASEASSSAPEQGTGFANTGAFDAG